MEETQTFEHVLLSWITNRKIQRYCGYSGEEGDRKCLREKELQRCKIGLRLYFTNMISVIQHTSLSLLTPTALLAITLKQRSAQDVGTPGTFIILQLGQANNLVPLKTDITETFLA
jgi:hypothetical protein